MRHKIGYGFLFFQLRVKILHPKKCCQLNIHVYMNETKPSHLQWAACNNPDWSLSGTFFQFISTFTPTTIVRQTEHPAHWIDDPRLYVWTGLRLTPDRLVKRLLRSSGEKTVCIVLQRHTTLTQALSKLLCLPQTGAGDNKKENDRCRKSWWDILLLLFARNQCDISHFEEPFMSEFFEHLPVIRKVTASNT